ncbi:MAG: S9 family peptidase [Candidatus Aminicenantes bacterium]|nr:S9 family peptidase [Candidatus Aminicenantes bacterium]
MGSKVKLISSINSCGLLIILLIWPSIVFGHNSLFLSSDEAQEKVTPFRLTIDNIMQGEELVGTSPTAVMWSYDSQKLYFRWRDPKDKTAGFYMVNLKDLKPKATTIEEIFKSPPIIPASLGRGQAGLGQAGFNLQFDSARRRALIVFQGDLRLMDLKTGKITQLTQTEARETNARFSFDEKKIIFTSEDNLYSYNQEDGSIKQLTTFTRQKPPAQPVMSEIDKWYLEQQRTLFKEIGRGRFPEMASLGEMGTSPKRRSFFLESNQSLTLLELTPDEKQVIFFLSEPDPEVKETLVPNYVTRTGYTETISSHPKAAYISPRLTRAGLMDVATGEVRWLELNQGGRRIFPTMVSWSPNGQDCVLLARAEDRKDHWLFRIDWMKAKAEILDQVHDEAWVGPLGLTNLFWSKDGRRLYYISEKDGFAHLYSLTLDGQERKKLTSGKFEVRSAQLSNDGQFIYFLSNEEHPGETHFYKMPINGGPRTRLTFLEGMNEVYLSPDEKWLALIHSETNRPPELYLQPNQPQAKAQQITVSPSEAFRSYHWAKPEIVTFKARDGFEVYARLYQPQSWHPSKPAVIFIHGAGYLQNAHKGWSTYYREYMFHNFLMEQGYLVFDVDYRGSAGYGRDCRTAIYRHMGGKDLDDIVDAAKFLVSRYGANPQKIGVYGGSYGGFLTLMAMFKEPDVFRAGAALRPVTDWAHYHPGYTVDILNLPHKDPEAYRQSSPIYFAEGLKGALLICHGMVDTNVHFQDSVRLVQRLIELRKENWELAIYPVEDHSFRNASSWADEYKRIFKLFETNLK